MTVQIWFWTETLFARIAIVFLETSPPTGKMTIIAQMPAHTCLNTTSTSVVVVLLHFACGLERKCAFLVLAFDLHQMSV